MDSFAGSGTTAHAVLNMNKAENHSYYLGQHKGTGYYFCYEPDQVTVLNHAFLSGLTQSKDGYVIYADLCALSGAELAEYGIIFRKIPRDVKKI